MKRQIILVLLALAALLIPLRAQMPTTIVVPAATSAAPSTAPTRAAVAADPNDSAKILQQLRQLKAANEETMRKQEALLQQLDELQQLSEQLRILISRS